jgi:hypothetical protein
MCMLQRAAAAAAEAVRAAERARIDAAFASLNATRDALAAEVVALQGQVCRRARCGGRRSPRLSHCMCACVVTAGAQVAAVAAEREAAARELADVEEAKRVMGAKASSSSPVHAHTAQ